MAERLSLAGGGGGGSDTASATLLDCSLADGRCCSCEWLSKALLCSCQLPSSSDEAGSPSRLNGNGAAHAHAHVTTATAVPKEHQC